MNYYNFHIGDYSTLTKYSTPMQDLAFRRMLDVYYALEKPLPTDTAKVAAKIGMQIWQDDVDSVLHEFFELTDEGWRNQRCDEDIAAYHEGAEERDARKAHENDRLKRFRADRRKMFADLRAKEIVPHWDIKMPELRKLHATACNVSARSTNTDANENATAITKNQEPITNNQGLKTKEHASHVPKAQPSAASPASPAMIDSETDADEFGKDFFDEFLDAAPATPAASVAPAEPAIPAQPANVPVPVVAKPAARASNGRKRGAKDLGDIDLPDWLPRDAWARFNAFRMTKPKGAAWLETTAEASIRELDSLRQEGSDPVRVIDRTIAGGHTGLFAIPGVKHQARVVPQVDIDAGMPPHLSPLEQRNWRNMQIALAMPDKDLSVVSMEEFH